MVDAPVLRFWRAVARFFHGVPDSEAAPCEYCALTVAPHMGERDNGQVFCSEECARYSFERTA